MDERKSVILSKQKKDYQPLAKTKNLWYSNK